MSIIVFYCIICLLWLGGCLMLIFTINDATYIGTCIRLSGLAIAIITFLLLCVVRGGRKRCNISKNEIKTQVYELVKFRTSLMQNCYVLKSREEDDKKYFVTYEFRYFDDNMSVKSESCLSGYAYINYASDETAKVRMIIYEQQYRYKFLFIYWPVEVERICKYELTVPEGTVARM